MFGLVSPCVPVAVMRGVRRSGWKLLLGLCHRAGFDGEAVADFSDESKKNLEDGT